MTACVSIKIFIYRDSTFDFVHEMCFPFPGFCWLVTDINASGKIERFKTVFLNGSADVSWRKCDFVSHCQAVYVGSITGANFGPLSKPSHSICISHFHPVPK